MMDTESDLLQYIGNHPADRGARLVYGDLLSARGDPRGELIALQAVDSPTPAQIRRIKQLLATHREQWLGPVAAAVEPKSCSFDLGFLDSATLVRWMPDPSPAGDPHWATVRALRLPPFYKDASLEVLVHPVLKGLAEVRGLASLDHLRRVCAAVENLEVVGVSMQARVPVDDVPIRIVSQRLSALHFTYPFHPALDRFLASAPKLERVVLRMSMSQPAHLPWLLERVRGTRVVQATVEVYAYHPFWLATATRRRDGWSIGIEVSVRGNPRLVGEAIRLLRQLPPENVHRVVLRVQPGQHRWTQVELSPLLAIVPDAELVWEELA